MRGVKGFSGAAVWIAAVVLAVMAVGRTAAQYPTTPYNQSSNSPYNTYNQAGTNPFERQDEGEEGEQQKPDTTKRKPRKPLESYFFGDSIRKRPNFVWNADTYRNRIDTMSIDTMLMLAQIQYPFQREDVGDFFLGPLGAGSIPINYMRRPSGNDFTFATPFYSYVFTPENARFYNVKRPLTILSYGWAGQRTNQEEILRVVHAQNISPSTGFNITYNNHGTRGIYTWQASKDKNLSLAFNHTGKRYTVHGGYIYNMASTRENGGMVNDADLGDKDLELPQNIPMKMSTPQNLLKNNTFYVTQSYGLPLTSVTDEDFSIASHPTIFVGHAFEYSRYWKRYTDTRIGTQYQVTTVADNGSSTTTNNDYYSNWYINNLISNDSIFEGRMSNRFFMQIQPWDRDAVIGTIDGGLGIDNYVYSGFSLQNYLSGFTKKREASYYVYGGLDGKFRQYFDWDGRLKYRYAGYRSGDLDIEANIALSAYIRKRPITLRGKFSQRLSSPGYWDERYFSNHFQWNNSFVQEKETRIGATIDAPFMGLEAGVWQSLASDKIYYNDLALPAQHPGTVSLTGVYVQENVRLGNFNFNHRVLGQWSSNQDVVPVPMVSAFLSYFFEFNVVKNVLRMQIGVDGRYFTKYYGFGYQPATAQFYNQRETKVGDYPMVDLFVNAKWKRMRILLKMQHLDEGFIEGRNYFDVAHYPLNKRILKLGISWGFYD